jgi:hypothetical protein
MNSSNAQFLLQSVQGNLIKFSVPDANMAMFATFPQTGKVYLLNQRPAPPSTEDLINRVNFQLQQIQFNQLRVPAAGL